MILVFDDKPEYRDIFDDFITSENIELEIHKCATGAELRAALQNPEILNKLKIVIFDLSQNGEEAGSFKFTIVEDIQNQYANEAIPIIIHSAFSDKISDFENSGTVFKIKKSASSVKEICSKIKQFYDSGFLEIFCRGGKLEKEIHREIQNAFVHQFMGNEISSILNSMMHAFPEGYKPRVQHVFQRIAIRSLYQKLMVETSSDMKSESEILMNAVEHYHRRRLNPPIWTGDIFSGSDGREIIILTPRCDIANGVCQNGYLSCNILPLEDAKKKEFAKGDKVKNFLVDNPVNTGLKYRYLIPTPLYHGGKIDLTSYHITTTPSFGGLDKKYNYVISLSDELTNEVVNKFAAYIQRSGISNSELTEAAFYSSISS